MHALVQTIAFPGIYTIPVEVYLHIANGLPTIAVVGLADKAVAESCKRVGAALSSIGLAPSPKRIAVNIAPADVVKEYAHFDLPIALGLLMAMGVVPQDAISDRVVLGELALDGSPAGIWCVVSGHCRGSDGPASDLSGRLLDYCRSCQWPKLWTSPSCILWPGKWLMAG